MLTSPSRLVEKFALTKIRHGKNLKVVLKNEPGEFEKWDSSQKLISLGDQKLGMHCLPHSGNSKHILQNMR